ncbi:MAG: glycerol-3-phosphate 1-O-acyltransferase PlsY [Sphingomonas sp.]|nr:glycerol-3-phosphate 1-O-acyltransferase PlsY [Sphingomonas sp.]
MLLGYVLGSIPFGLLLTRFAGLGDVRDIGSGNIGATNVLRTGRKGLAAVTLILDAAKGAAAVLIAQAIWPDANLGGVAGIAAFLGHLYPVWLRFRGGKGVATMIGIVAALLWPAALIVVAVWLLALAVSRRSSVGGMSGALAAPVATFVLGRLDLTILFLGFALLILWTHRANIARLIDGTEPRVGKARG